MIPENPGTQSTERTLAELYGLASPQSGAPHAGYRGTRTVPVTDASGAELYLRLYPEHWRGRAGQVAAELAWLRALRAARLPVVEPVTTPTGQAFLTTPEGLPAAAFRTLPGEPRYPLSAAEAAAFGELLARLHLSAAPPGWAPDLRYDAETLLERPLHFGSAYLNAAERLSWRRLGDALRAAVATLPTGLPIYGPIHGDPHQWNVHWTDAGPHLLDFALCGEGFRLFDLATFLWPLRDGTAQEDGVSTMCEAFLEGYRAQRPLHPAEEAALPAFVKLRDLYEMLDFADWEPNFDPVRDVPGYLRRFQAYPGPFSL